MNQSPEEYLRECLRLDPLFLEEEFVRVVPDLAFWNEQYALAYRRHLDAELDRKTLYGRLYMEHQAKLEMSRTGTRKPTVGEVESAVTTDPSYVAAKHAENVADGERVRLLGICEALRAKKDMLVSLGAHQRAEMGHDPSIRKQVAIEHEMQRNRAAG